MSKQLHFSVSGTTCASCEILLERELKTIPGVEKVEASHTSGKVTLTVADGVKVKPQDLEHLVGSHGYRFKFLDKEEGTGNKEHETGSEDAPRRFSWGRLGGTILLVWGMYLLLKRFGVLTFSPTVEQASGLGAVFVIGLVAAFSSCTAVVSGLVAAVSSNLAKAKEAMSLSAKIRPLLLFNAGRLVGFAGFGAVIGLIGKAVSLSTGVNGLLVLVIAIFMIGLGVNLLEVLPASFNVLRPPKWLAHKIHDLSESEKPHVPFVLGAATFFLPCGFTQSMQLLALSTGNPLAAATIMLVFALGTLPALLGVGVVMSSAKGKTLKYLTRLAGAIVLVLGFTNVANGAALLGWNVNIPSSSAQQVAKGPTLVNGEQVIQMEVNGAYGYNPDVLRVKAGTPVRWEVYGGRSMGCASTLVARAFGIAARLQPGLNTLTFTPKKPGKYTFSCSMGMYRGTMIVES